MMKKILFFCFIIPIYFCSAQGTLMKMWDKRYGGSRGDGLKIFRETSDHGFVLGGASQSGVSFEKTQPNWDPSLYTNDYWVLKVDSAGNIQWDKRFGGTNFDELLCLEETRDGGYILGGHSNSMANGDKSQPCWSTDTTV
jgi:hypothetical protein